MPITELSAMAQPSRGLILELETVDEAPLPALLVLLPKPKEPPAGQFPFCTRAFEAIKK